MRSRLAFLASLTVAFVAAGGLPCGANPGVVREIRASGGILVDVVPRTVVEAGGGIALSPGRDASAFSWQLQSTSTAVFTDLSMAGPTRGFASAELGRVFRTTDGVHWTQVLNQGFPFYWYGVHAFAADTVLITGFNNSSGEGIARWSRDGGGTWGSILVIDPSDWLTTVQFADRQHGVTTNIGGGSTFATTSGGAAPGDWSAVTADPTGGWFSGNFTFLAPGLHVYLAGISFCHSRDGGLSYTQAPSADPVFDGGVSFPDSLHGWTGGGQISAPVQGWVHRTVDGGQSWSGRLLNPPYPIRSVLFFDDSLGFAVGGNYFQATGGIWSTADGGNTWSLDVTTGTEMKGIDWARVGPESVDVWCAGSTSGLGKIYHTRLRFPEAPTSVAETPAPGPAVSVSAGPNPFRTTTRLSIRSAVALREVCLTFSDPRGRLVRRLELGDLAPGVVEAHWDGREDNGRAAAGGLYLVRLVHAGGAFEGTKLLHIR